MTNARLRVHVEGVVQGVGFRPFVYALAGRLKLAGLVGNDVEGVFIEVEGAPARVDEFLARLRTDAPPLATIDAVTTTSRPALGAIGFRIVASDPTGERRTGVSVDSATCDDCLRDLYDPADRRYRYPFVNCTNCGPRFTITRDVPYDRPFTTMAGFSMCCDCSAEYYDPADRRFHAQPVCCPACGPQLTLVDGTLVDGTSVRDEPIRRTAERLRSGAVVAVKGLGGYHLAVDAGSDAATRILRRRKRRDDKPFAVMVADLDMARALGTVDEAAAALLADRRRPIVLLDRRAGHGARFRLAGPVAPGNRQIGVMLPYTPLHHLLLDDFGGPIVLTSGNVSDEPIAYTDDDARTRLADIADAFLTHDRPIYVRVDDSVARIHQGRPMLLRRGRGYAPEPVRLRWPALRPVLACGAELKNTFCLLTDTRAVVSQHIGDLENYPTLRSYADGIAAFTRLFDVVPEVIAHDLHPEYLSTKYALDRAGEEEVDLVGVQHHHAHIASCLADNGEAGPVIGIAFDGTGYGPDGTIWGGEFLLADLATYRRLGHLLPVPLPGGATAIRQPWRMAVSYLGYPSYLDPGPGAAVLRRHAEWPTIATMARQGVNSPLTSSAGRLFDAVAALLGIRDEVTYEGQAAIELEQRADPYERGSYPAALTAGTTVTVAGADLVHAAAHDLADGVAVEAIAARFHNGLSAATVRTCVLLRERTGVSTVALSGGVFQNALLLSRTTQALVDNGFRVLVHCRIPPNDGGISLGQAAVAAARDRTGYHVS